MGNFGGVDRDSRGLTRRRTGALRLTQPLGGPASRVRLRADADTADYDLEFRARVLELARRHRRARTDASQIDAALSAALGVSAGIDGLREHGGSTYITNGATAIPVERGVGRGLRRGALAAARARRHSAPAPARAHHARCAARRSHGVPPRPAFAADTSTR